eukprot:SAG11_NODE_36439_length_261_cov_1.246914_1_plen_34_part_01
MQIIYLPLVYIYLWLVLLVNLVSRRYRIVPEQVQ